MTLAYFLSTYPKAILDDEMTVVLLGVLERQGASTTAELADVTGREPSEVIGRVVTLYVNQLVTIEGDVIRLNVRGKTLLDRFEVGDAVIGELLKETTPDEDTVRGVLQSLLSAFRSDAYVEYLATLRTQHLLTACLRQQTPTPLPSGRGMRLALLFRDVEDWTAKSSSPLARDAARRLDGVFATALKVDRHGSGQPLRSAIVLFAEMRPESPRAKATEPLRLISLHQPETGWHRQILKIDELQRHHSARTWLQASCLAARTPEEDQLAAVESLLVSQWETLESQLEQADLLEEGDPLRDVPPASDALALLLGSVTRAEFASSLGLTDGGAVTLLRAIEQKCEALISAEGPSVNDD